MYRSEFCHADYPAYAPLSSAILSELLPLGLHKYNLHVFPLGLNSIILIHPYLLSWLIRQKNVSRSIGLSSPNIQHKLSSINQSVHLYSCRQASAKRRHRVWSNGAWSVLSNSTSLGTGVVLGDLGLSIPFLGKNWQLNNSWRCGTQTKTQVNDVH